MTARLLILFMLCASPAIAGERMALVGPDGTVLRYDSNIDPEAQTKEGYQWLPAPEAIKPAYDSATQVLSGPTITVGKDAVTTEYTVRDKTAQELADEAEATKEDRLGNVELFVLQTLCDHESRIRVREGKSAITFDQCRQAIKDKLR